MNIANLSLDSSKINTQKVKMLIFSVGNLNAGLHIDTVQKVINYNTIFSSGLNHYGLVNIGEEEITVIDLHKKLFNLPQNINSDDKKYLLLAVNSANETFGILIKSTPELYDLSLEDIRELPPSYRRADTLKIASHVTVIVEEDQERTVFILDPDELIAP